VGGGDLGNRKKKKIRKGGENLKTGEKKVKGKMNKKKKKAKKGRNR